MRWKWVLGIALFCVVAMVATAWVVLSRYDFNDFKPEIARAVKNATGREITLAGDIALATGLRPALVVENVGFQNAQWGSRPQMATVKRLEIQVSLAPLMKGVLQVERLVLIEPDIFIETNASGRSNLEFGVDQEDKTGEPDNKHPVEQKSIGTQALLPALLLDKIRILNGRLTYKDGATRQIVTAVLEQLTATGQTDELISLDLKGTYNNTPYLVEGIVGRLPTLTNPNKAWPITLTAQAAKTRVSLKGHIKDVFNGRGLALSVSGDGKSVPILLGVFNVRDVPEVGPFAVAGNLSDAEGKLAVKDLELVIGTEDQTKAHISGTVNDILTLEGLNLSVRGQGQSVPQVVRLFSETNIPEVGPFNVAGSLSDAKGKLSVKALDLVIGTKDQTEAHISGTIHDLLAFQGLNLSVRGQGQSIPQVVRLFSETNIPEVGPFNVAGSLSDATGKLSVKALDLVIGTKDQTEAHISGTIHDLLAFQGLNLSVRGQGKSVLQAVRLFTKAAVPDVGPFAVTGTLTDPDGSLSLTGFNLKLGTEELAFIQVSGKAKEITALKGIEMDFSITGRDARKINTVIGKPLPFAGPFHVSGHAVLPTLKSFSISDLKMTLEESDLGGSLALDLSHDKPQLQVSVSSQKLDLRPYFPEKSIEKKETAKKEKVFSETPLPFELLDLANAHVEVQAKRVYFPLLAMKDLTARAIVKDGDLTLIPFKGHIDEGTFNSRLEIKAGKHDSQLDMALEINQLDIGRILKGMDLQGIVEGKIDLEMDMMGRGKSLATLMATLNGQSVLTMGNGKVNEHFIGLFSGDLSNYLQLLSAAKKEVTFTDISCLVVGLDITNGLAKSTAIVLDTSTVSIIGRGEVDLAMEKLDLALKPSKKKGVGIKGLGKFSLSLGELTKPLKISGTLAKPVLAIDPSATFVTLGKAIGGAVLLGPAGIAAALAGGKLGNKDPCVAAMKAATSGKLDKSAKVLQDKNRGDKKP